nr:hypothetical protein [Morchella crassipes]
MKRGARGGGGAHSLFHSLYKSSSLMALWAKREGEGPFYIFNFLKKIKMKRGPLPLHHPGLCLHSRPVLGLSFLPPLSIIDPPSLLIFFCLFLFMLLLLQKIWERGRGDLGRGGLGVWVGKPASFPLFYNEKGGDLLFYLTLVELRSTNACLKKDMFFLNHPSLSNMDYSHNPGYDREGRAKKLR